MPHAFMAIHLDTDVEWASDAESIEKRQCTLHCLFLYEPGFQQNENVLIVLMVGVDSCAFHLQLLNNFLNRSQPDSVVALHHLVRYPVLQLVVERNQDGRQADIIKYRKINKTGD